MDFLPLKRESSIPAHKFSLNESCIRIIMSHLDINQGLFKNCPVLVEQLHERVSKIRLIDTSSPQQTFCIPHTTFVIQ